MNVVVEKTKEANKDIQPYLVDVPVLVMIWSRCELQRKQFEIIRQAKPSVLFFVSDGGRNENEQNLIEESRNIVSNIDWECTVHRLYWNKNQGMYSTGAQSREYLFKHVDRAIFLEDDIMPSVTYFSFCAELLERYKDDMRIHVICGMNHLGQYDRPDADYFFARVGSIWGYATWKRTYELELNHSYKNSKYVIDEVCNIAKKDTYFCKALCGYADNDVFDGHKAGPEFFQVFGMFAENQLFIISSKNMICCDGVVLGSTHAADNKKKMSKGSAQIFGMKTYEIMGDLKHPDYVFPDLTYEKKMKRIMAWHHPIISRYRWTVGIIKRIRYGDGKILLQKLCTKTKNKLLGKTNYER